MFMRGENPATENHAMTTRKTNPPEPTAAEMYAARRADIARLLDVLDMELQAHAEQAAAKPRDYGMPCNLYRVRSVLIDAVGFLSNKDRAAVEAFLAE